MLASVPGVGVSPTTRPHAVLPAPRSPTTSPVRCARRGEGAAWSRTNLSVTAWIRACATDDIEPDDLIRFDHGGATYAIYHSPEGDFFATAGKCTHEDVHLCDGLVMGHLIECPKHNGQFDYRTGEAMRAPVCVNLKTFPVKVEGDRVYVEVA